MSSDLESLAPPKKSILIHYSEISLKKRNRSFFERTLLKNIQQALKIPNLHIIRHSGCFTFSYPESLLWEEIQQRLSQVFGIHSFSIVYQTEKNIEKLSSAILRELASVSFGSFGVVSQREDKKFPMNSQAINVRIGADIKTTFQKKVDLSHPDLWVHIEVLQSMCCFHFKKYPGPAGLPVGVSGRLMCLISGGIDSPVAALKMMSRGAPITFVHFHSFPFTNANSMEKVELLLRRMASYQGSSVVYLVPFAELQQEIVALAQESLRVLLYRRFMMRVAEALAKKEKALGLVTGESLGQVASQTLENIAAVNRVVEIPVLRPLIGSSKEEIILLARSFRTYETSILPHDDCCTFLMPKNPCTHTTHEILSEAEKAFESKNWIEILLQKTERKIIFSES